MYIIGAHDKIYIYRSHICNTGWFFQPY